MIYALDTNTISNLLRGEGNIEKTFSRKLFKQEIFMRFRL